MTTDNKGVSASTDSAEAIAAAVSAAAAPAEPAVGEPLAPAAEPAQGLTLSDLETSFKSFEGRNANWNAQKMREIEQGVNARIDQALAPFVARQQADELARVEQLDAEDQAAYWKQQATAPAPEPSAPPAQPTQGADTYSAEQRLSIINETTNMLASEGLNVSHTDNRLWAGATNGMTPEQLVGIARVYAQKLKAPSQPPPAAAPAATPPPSTQAAPSSSSTTYGSRTELNAALLSGEIPNIDEFNRIGLESGILKPRN
jgi:hypothetical protein